jgi:hypothetical protein
MLVMNSSAFVSLCKSYYVFILKELRFVGIELHVDKFQVLLAVLFHWLVT